MASIIIQAIQHQINHIGTHIDPHNQSSALLQKHESLHNTKLFPR